MSELICPRCHSPSSQLFDVPPEVSIFLKKNLSKDFIIKKVCGSCGELFKNALQDPNLVPNKTTAENLKRVEAWSRRTEVLRVATNFAKAGKKEEALKSYEEYLKLMEEGLGLPVAQITPQFFRETGRSEEQAVFALVLWDLLLLYDGVNEARQREVATHMTLMSKGLPLAKTLQARIRKQERLAKNKALFKQLNKDFSGGGCFIASFAFENAYAEEVMILRNFRDETLEQSRAGRAFIRAYYKVSPILVKVLSQFPMAKPAIRKIVRFAIQFNK